MIRQSDIWICSICLVTVFLLHQSSVKMAMLTITFQREHGHICYLERQEKAAHGKMIHTITSHCRYTEGMTYLLVNVKEAKNISGAKAETTEKGIVLTPESKEVVIEL